MSKLKKDLEQELESLNTMMRDYAVRLQNMTLKLNDNERLLQHYERPILVLLERIMEQRVALSSHTPTATRSQAGES